MRGKNILATGKELPSTAELDMTLFASQSQVHREEISEDRVIDVDVYITHLHSVKEVFV